MNQNLLIQGEMSPREHIQRIRNALETARQAVFDVAIVINDAVKELGEDRFQNEVASELGMTKGTLSKWLSIASSERVLEYRQGLPSTFSTLYELTLVEKTLFRISPDTADIDFVQLIETEIHPATEMEQVRVLHSKVKQRITRNRANKIGQFPSQDSGNQTIDSLRQTQKKFATFVVWPSKTCLSAWDKEDCLVSKITQDFPLAEVRETSLRTTLQMLIVLPARYLRAGIKMCSAFGFGYTNLFVPRCESSNLDTELIVIRCERGRTRYRSDIELSLVNHRSVIELANTIGNSPYLMVGGEKSINSSRKSAIPPDWEWIPL